MMLAGVQLATEEKQGFLIPNSTCILVHLLFWNDIENLACNLICPSHSTNISNKTVPALHCAFQGYSVPGGKCLPSQVCPTARYPSLHVQSSMEVLPGGEV